MSPHPASGASPFSTAHCSLLELAISTPRTALMPEGCTCTAKGGSTVAVLWLGSWSVHPAEGDARAVRREDDPCLDPWPTNLGQVAHIPINCLGLCMTSTQRWDDWKPITTLLSPHPVCTAFWELSVFWVPYPSWSFCDEALLLFLLGRFGNSKHKEIHGPGSQTLEALELSCHPRCSRQQSSCL